MTNNRIISPATYLVVWIVLLFLLLLNWWLAQLKLGLFNVGISFGIAAIQAFLMLVYMMHAKVSGPLIRLVMAIGFIWLMIMFDLTLSDYLTRGAVPDTLRQSWIHGAWPSASFSSTNSVEDTHRTPPR